VTPATLLPDAVKLLRGTGFRGVIVSGDLAAATLATGGSVADAAVAALKAGCDLLYVPGDAADQEAAYRAVVRALRLGQVPATRVAASLHRLAALRRAYGIGG
jgi:beta-N-acetylhexosaminidase